MEEKKFFKLIIRSVIVLLLIIGSVMIIVDPYFHYHKPLSILKYRLGNQRYINDGIIRNFNYNGMIIGTSMTENFKTTQFDKIFNVKSIKVPFSGGSFKEINENIERSLERNKKLQIILRGLDYRMIQDNSEKMRYDSYPEYLYDDNILNDYKYILNKEIILKGLGGVILNTLKERKISFDDYSSWRDRKTGKEIVISNYIREVEKKEITNLSENEITMIKENIERNVLKTAKKYSDVKFIYFITPYSIVYWDSIYQNGKILKQLEAEKIMIEMILKVSNIELYSFFNNYELITNLDNYTDAGHYSYKINDKILEWISQKKYRLTKDNYENYLESNKEFYLNYDYDKIFEK